MSLFHHRLLMAKALEMANPYLPWDTPKAIKDAMVLYYDIAKQKATNESMSLSPILKDLSGNGNDATCYNFGWSGMSGIGGYNYNFRNSIIYKSSAIKEDNSVVFNTVTRGENSKINSYIFYLFPTVSKPVTGTFTISAISVHIDNPNGYNLMFGLRYDSSTDNLIKFNDSRTIDIPEQEITVDNTPITIGLYFVDDEKGTVDANITITQLPLYPNALVSDGVNDYCLVQDRYYYTGYHSDFATSLDYTKDGFRSLTINSNKVEETKFFIYLKTVGVGVDYDYKIRITGLDEFKKTYPNAYFANQQGDEAYADGEYHWQGTTTYQHVTLILFPMETLAENTPINITIEQLPLNKKSLVLNKEDGYTVIARRKHLRDIENQRGSVCSKQSLYTDVSGAFSFEGMLNNQGIRTCQAINFGIKTTIDSLPNNISYQTSKKYNNINIGIGSTDDTDMMVIGKLDNTTSNYFSNLVLYSLILFNRDLTTDEIEWVKTNLIEGD